MVILNAHPLYKYMCNVTYFCISFAMLIHFGNTWCLKDVATVQKWVKIKKKKVFDV